MDSTLEYRIGIAAVYLYSIYRRRPDFFSLAMINIMEAEDKDEAIEREYRKIGPWTLNL